MKEAYILTCWIISVIVLQSACRPAKVEKVKLVYGKGIKSVNTTA